MFYPVTTYDGDRQMTLLTCTAFASETLENNKNARAKPGTNAFFYRKEGSNCTIGTMIPFSDRYKELFEAGKSDEEDPDGSYYATTYCAPSSKID